MSWAELSPAARARAEKLRTPEGAALALEGNFLVDTAFSKGVLTPLDDEAIAPYRAPYPDAASRRPLLEWARSLPLDGEPADVAERLDHYRAWLATSHDIPKLLLTFDSSPTLLITPELADWCTRHIANLETRHCGPAGHHAPEDQPETIATAIADWADRHALR